MKLTTRSLVFFIIVLLPPTSAAARDRDPADLVPGMEYHEVVREWGPPEEKLEREMKREDLWIYQDFSVTFREGKLFSAEQIEKALFNPSSDEKGFHAANRSTQSKAKARGRSHDITAILKEIMNGTSAEAIPQEDKPLVPAEDGTPPTEP